MSIRRNQIRLVLLISLFVALVATAGTPTPPPPKEATLTCESIPEMKLGEKGIISCTDFTPIGEVKVIFHRPDGSTSEHLGKADEYGNFDGNFTVAPDRPPGQWTLNLTDVSSGRKIAMPFTVIPSLIATLAVTPLPTDNLRVQSPEIPDDLFESLMRYDISILALFGCLGAIMIGLILLLIRLGRNRSSEHDAPPTPGPENNDFALPPEAQAPPPPPAEQPADKTEPEQPKEEAVKPPEPPEPPQPPQAPVPPVIGGPEDPGARIPRQGPCGFSSKVKKKVFGGWRFGGSMAGEITEPEKPPHTHVIWERDVWLESEEYGPCPLPIDHPGDHQPRLWETILQGTEKLTVHYDAFIKGSDAKKLTPTGEGQPPDEPAPVDADLQFIPAG